MNHHFEERFGKTTRNRMTVENHKEKNIKTNIKGRNDGGLPIFLEWGFSVAKQLKLKSV